MLPLEFIEKFSAPAQATQLATGIPASFTIAQAALESGWATSQLAIEAYNYFGVKADASWTGEVQEWQTKEFLNGQWVFISAAFRRYPGVTEGLKDHATFLTTNPRYQPCFAWKNDSWAFARAVQKAGYATDPEYAKKIIEIFMAHDLRKFDSVT
jgi:flagellum-specific peptidoglycan hydrolase FlgJ